MVQVDLFGVTAAGRWADVSACGRYRYGLGVRWADGPCLGWIALNPSTADAEIDDATSRRFRSFSMRDGYGSYEVVNLDAFRATDPRALRTALRSGVDVVGERNDVAIGDMVERTAAVVLAWGGNGHHRLSRVLDVLSMVERSGKPLLSLGYTRDGHPVHPLRIRAVQPFDAFARQGELAVGAP